MAQTWELGAGSPATFISSAHPNTHYTAGADLPVGKFTSTVDQFYLYFYLGDGIDIAPELLTGTYSNVKLVIYQMRGDCWSNSVTLRASFCTNYVDVFDVTWNNKPAISGSFSQDITISGNSLYTRQWDMPSDIKGVNLNTLKLNDGTGNYWLIVKVWATVTTTENAKYFYSPDATNPDYTPYLSMDVSTAPNIKIYANGIWNPAKNAWVYANAGWQPVKGMWTYSGGVWQKS